MDSIVIAKKVTSLVVGVGVTKIVRAIIKNNVTPENVIDQVTITAAAMVLGGIVANVSQKYTDSKIDELVKFWNENLRPKKEETAE